MKENVYQKRLKDKIEKIFPDCIVTKLDSGNIQGVPDLLILVNDKWATLEVKVGADAPHRPNQDHYVSIMDSMSFSRFIYPENEDLVLSELSEFFYA